MAKLIVAAIKKKVPHFFGIGKHWNVAYGRLGSAVVVATVVLLK